MTFPSEQHVLDFFRSRAQQHFTLKRLIQQLAVPAHERPAFRRLIRALAARGSLLRLHGSHYALPERLNALFGVVQRHEDGYGFVVPEDPEQEDVYIPRQAMAGVMHGDRVMARLDPSQGRGERSRGRIVQVIEREPRDIVGRVEMMGKACWLLPAEARLCPPIAIAPRRRLQARSGVVAVAEIVSFTASQAHPEGKIIEILGEADDPDLDLALILRKYDLPSSFPPDVEAAAAAIPMHVQDQDFDGRQDLRHLITFTIDGETARDFDDAVSLERLPNGHWQLGVHIADVSHYVRAGSALDREAYARGTSVYLPDRVIPMLPPRLSNDVCCLQPEVDRLTLSVLIELTAAGNTVRYDIVDAVIRSQGRLTYTRVAEYLDGNPRALDSWNPAIGEVLFQMAQLAAVLRRQRLAAGSVDFDLPESDIILDNDGKIDKILRAERNEAHLLIEDFMLLANRTVAAHLAQLRVPALYRIHEPPSLEKAARLQAFVQTFGYALEAGERLRPRVVQTLLEAVQGKPEEQLVNHMLLRSMSRARYAVNNRGHFGLAFAHYTHFTSPIRRYPDLLVHRLLRDTASATGMSTAQRVFWSSRLPEMAEQTSRCERLADDAEREVVDLKKAEFMRDKLGQEYFGVITNVAPFGLFVELEELFIEGLVHVAWLPDAFVFDESRLCLVGQRTGQVYRLGERVRIRVDNVNIQRRQIDFSLVARA